MEEEGGGGGEGKGRGEGEGRGDRGMFGEKGGSEI